ncbi:MAG: hypothetical protein U0103_13035 [Candidatus Obscuribacterales bacterium]
MKADIAIRTKQGSGGIDEQVIIKSSKSTILVLNLLTLANWQSEGLASNSAVDSLKYLELKKSWAPDDTVTKAFETATYNVDIFVRQMSTYYGLPVSLPGTRTWRYDLHEAIRAAGSRDWNSVIKYCDSAVLSNPNSMDAFLLRAVANSKIHQTNACIVDLKAIHNLRELKARSHMRTGFVFSGQNPVADYVLNLISSNSTSTHRSHVEIMLEK